MAGMYTAGGKIATTTVDGSARVNLYAADGTINIVLDNATGANSIYHPCGALRVSTTTSQNYYHPSGSVSTNRLFGPGR